MELTKSIELGSLLLHLLESAQKSRFSEKRHLSWDLATLRSQIVRSLSLQKDNVSGRRRRGELPACKQGDGEISITLNEFLSCSGEIASLPLGDGPPPLGMGGPAPLPHPSDGSTHAMVRTALPPSMAVASKQFADKAQRNLLSVVSLITA